MSFHLPTNSGGADASEGQTVLVVDDYRSLTEMISAMLRPRGYRVLTASSGQQAKALARENAKIDLLLTDMEMPEMRGDELAAWFRTAKPATRILFMSSQPAFRKELEPSPFLEKPFRTEELINKVRDILNHYSSVSPKPAAI